MIIIPKKNYTLDYVNVFRVFTLRFIIINTYIVILDD